jgi:hypothetical protein
MARTRFHFERSRSHDFEAEAVVEALGSMIVLPDIQVDAGGSSEKRMLERRSHEGASMTAVLGVGMDVESA